ncbi:hypothetical protein NKG94_24835 [Micromonospora sp. M12]
MLVPPAVLAGVGLLAGPAASVLDHVLRPYADLLGGVDAHLALWSGPTPALALSVVALVGGGLLFAVRGRSPGAGLAPRAGGGNQGYEWVVGRFDRLAIEVTSATQRGSLPQYLGIILVTLVLVPGAAMLSASPGGRGFRSGTTRCNRWSCW